MKRITTHLQKGTTMSDDCRESEPTQTFETELARLIDKHSQDRLSNTPNHVLTQYIMSCLLAFNTAVQQRETRYGRDARPSQTFRP